MNEEKKYLKEKIPFGQYRPDSLSNRIYVLHLPIKFEVLKSDKNPQIVGETFDVTSISHREIVLNKDKGQKYKYPDIYAFLNTIEGKVFVDNKEVAFDLLMSELKYKDATKEFAKLPLTLLKDGKYLGNYFPDSLINFFKQSEDNFFMLDQCIISYVTHDRFQFPKNPDDRERLEKHIKNNYPGLYSSLGELFIETQPTTEPSSVKSTQRPT